MAASTACPDWADRLVSRQSIIPPPLFPELAEHALATFKALRMVDAPGSPTFGEACGQWVFDFVSAIFGAENPDTGERLIREFLLCVSKKNSKALALDTPIPTPGGWTTMGELQPGDLVFGVDGNPCQVLATSPVFENHKCYRLGFSNGESVVADAGHLWKTSALADAPGSGRKGGKGRRCRVRTTQEIADTLHRQYDGARNHSIEMPRPIECAEADLPVAPYTLGAWLGDGHSDSARITLHPEDSEILDGIRADGWPVRFAHSNGSAANTYAISDGDRSQAARSMSLAARLRRAGVLNDKHIPEVYFRGSFKQRLALLQGLMDTDGTISKSGKALSFCGINERLVRGVSDLLATLGIKNTVTTRPVTCNGVPAGVAFFVQFMAFRDQLPCFRLKRKLDRMLDSGRDGNRPRSRTVQIISAEQVPSVPVKCISVDSPDRQFLFGRSMLPTHNSTIAAGIMVTAAILNWRKSAELLILAPTIEVASNAFQPARDMIKADPELDYGQGGIFHVQEHTRTITHKVTGATLKVVAADDQTVSGKKAAFVLVDELWLFGKNAKADSMLREATGGLVARPEGFVIYLTTQADAEPAGVFKTKLNYFRRVRDGEVSDPKSLPVLYEFPPAMVESKAYLEPGNFYVTNPNIGRSVSASWLEDELRKVQDATGGELQVFLAKHLNVEIGLKLANDRWSGADYWEGAADPTLVGLPDLLARSEVAVVGIDGGGLDDLFGVGVIGRCKTTRDWLCWTKAWAHDDVLERRKEIATVLRDFERAGDLTITDDPLLPIREAADIVQTVRDAGLMPDHHGVGIDPWGAAPLVDELAARGIEGDMLAAVRQGSALTPATWGVELKLKNGTLWHSGSRMMAWCVGNAKVETRGGAVLITKQTAGRAKIDPLVALFNAAILMSRNPEASGMSYLEDATMVVL